MYLSKTVSRIRMREAEKARENRREIVRALSHGQITRRDLFRWGIFTATGALALKNGLSPFARSAYAAVPTGTPPSPIPAGKKFTQPMQRLALQQPLPLTANRYTDPLSGAQETEYLFTDPVTKQVLGAPPARRTSYHTYWNDPRYRSTYTNAVTGLGPIEGRPPAHADGDFFAHQRWNEVPPKVGYLLSLGQIAPGSKFHPDLVDQEANSVWSFASRYNRPLNYSPSPTGLGTKPNGYYGCRTGSMAPPLIRARYNEPIICRIHNDLPVDRELNNGFGRNEISTHYHNAHNGAESDGACNAYHFPGTFYDYHWSSMLARHDHASYASKMDSLFKPDDPRASTPTDNGRRDRVQGDFREIQGTMWFHDHRFFFTAENVHKGNFGAVNMYSGLDRGNEELNDGVNLRLPSGNAESWGNLDYDVNLVITNPALDQKQQLFFDIFDTDGFLGDILATNGGYYPFYEVASRRYRFRILNASMSRFLKLALVTDTGQIVPFHFIANDGNFLPRPIPILDGTLDEQGVAERYDIIVDFAGLPRSVKKVYLVNTLQQTNGRKPDGPVSIAQAMRGVQADPCVGPVLEFRIGSAVRDQSIDLFGADRNKVFTSQIPLQTPVRTRTIEFVSSKGDSRQTLDGQCIPDCGNAESFPWSVRVNGQASHSLNATRIGALIPRPGEVEHWTLINSGGGWDHPIHLHFEEAITLDRGSNAIPDTEKMVRKDVWRLRPSGQVRIQVRFGEFGGSYVSHCHNTVHEDFAMLMRYQLLSGDPNSPLKVVPPTPLPDPVSMTVTWRASEVLPEADPANTRFFGNGGTSSSSSGKGGSGKG